MSYTVRALQALNIHDIIVEEDPSSENEFFSQSHKIVDHDSNNSAIFTSDPTKFGVTWDEVNTKRAELIAEDEAQEYARNRKLEYPDWSDQLNKIYDDGLTKWKSEMVDPVKTKWPKDNSGPK
jgi:hypothetical protein